jgi:hypothetical protein
MNYFRLSVLSLMTVTSTMLGLSTQTNASTISQSLNFSTNNQSIWSTGGNFSFSHPDSVTASWGANSADIGSRTLIPGIPGFCVPTVFWGDQCTPSTPDVNSPGVHLSTNNGTVQIQNTFSGNGGLVNANIPVNVQLNLPDAPIKPGSLFNIGTGYSLDPTASFQTFSPNFSDSLGLNINTSNQLSVDSPFNINQGLNIDTNGPVNLFTLDGSNTSVSFAGGSGSFSAHTPQINTTSGSLTNNILTSHGSDIYSQGSSDLIAVASDLLHTVGVEIPPLSFEQQVGFSGSNLDLGYNLLSSNLTSSSAVNQDFSLAINSLPATLSLLLNDGTTQDIPFTLGDTLALQAPSNWTGQAKVQTSLDALFTNNTSFTYSGSLGITGPSAKLQAEVAGDTLVNQSIDPLFDPSVPFDIASVAGPPDSFALGGFNTNSIDFSVPIVTPTPTSPPTKSVPEPGVVVGLLTIGFGFFTKKRQQQSRCSG